MIKLSKQDLVFYFLIFFISCLVLLNVDQPFFWDKDILDAKQAYWFIENNFSLILPDSIDPGHPPLMGLTLALLWAIFGKHLILGHLLMWFVGIGVLFQVKRLSEYFFPKALANTIMLLIMLETALLTQIVVVSSDLVLTFFFLLSVNNILRHKKNLLILSLVGLSLANLRGMTTAFGLFFFHIYYSYLNEENKSGYLKLLLPYMIASIPSIIFLAFHFFSKGWLVLNENGPWAGCYEKVGIPGLVKNIAVYTWRMLDAGRIFIWVGITFLGYKLWKNKIPLTKHFKLIAFLFIIVVGISLPSALTSNMLIDNRYFLPIFISLSLLFGILLELSTIKTAIKKKLSYIAIIAIISGSFWVYPDHLSTCWSASLSHISYYGLKKEMNTFIIDSKIDRHTIGSYVPNVSQERFTELNDNTFSYKRVDFKTNHYIFYSNVYNISDEDLEELNKNWTILKPMKKGLVKVILYERR